MAVFDDMQPIEKLKIYDKGIKWDKAVDFASFLSDRHDDISIPSIQMKEPLVAEEQHFVNCILEKKTPITDGREAMRVLNCLVAASRSLADGGKPIEVVR